MQLLSHFNPAHKKILGVIDEHWPFQFLPEYSSFELSWQNREIRVAYDRELQAMIPLRFYDLKYFTHAQVLFAPLRNGVELNSEEQLLFFRKLIKTLNYDENCDRIVQPHPYSVLASVPPEADFCEFGSYIVDLENQSHDEILNRFHPKYQKAVNHTIKHGAEIKTGPDVLQDFYKTYDLTMKRVGKPSDSYEYFSGLYKYLGNDRICCAVIYDQGEPVSGIFLIYTKYGAFLTHAGTQGESKLYGAAKLLNFEIMKSLKEKGVKRYDFVGVRLKNENNPELEGVFRFKKGFGGDLKSGYLWKQDLRPAKARLFDLLIFLKSKGKKSMDIIDQVNG